MENELQDRICGRCGKIVPKTKRLAIMVDGILQVSIPLCLWPCYKQAMDSVMPMLSKLSKEESYAV